MNQPTLGVLITYYNERELFRQCLYSLQEQSCAVDEILVYDDASAAPAADYVPEGFPLRILRGPINHGPSFGRNVLLNASRCDYIHFHDADDLFEPSWCERVRGPLTSGGVDAVFTEVSAYDGRQLLCERVMGLAELAAAGDLLRFCIHGAILPGAATCRKSSVLAIGGYREDLWQSEDFDFHVRLAAQGIRYALILDPLVRRMRACGRSGQQQEVWSSACQAIKRLAQELPAPYHPDLAEAAAKAGSMLFRLDARQEARAAFELAAALGPPAFGRQRRAYRLLSRSFGPERTEQWARLYRHGLPDSLRRWVANIGW
ncbi:MAG: glycosyltransferase [Acidobacteria bacterium]|nr:glycosyltransferase [Acidobacteriota bacterium]MBI3656035.1 glycosyltransferase [Acidobacteriota bacterium]